MELVVGTNCYTDVEQANQLIADNFMSSSPIKKMWDSLENSDKTILIYSNTKICDKDSMLYKWFKQSADQPLQFPRVMGCNGQVIECPDLVKLGILVQGIRSVIETTGSSDNFTALQASGVKSFADGSGARIEFASSSDLKGTDNNKNSLGIYNGVFKQYFKEYTEFV